MAFITQKTSFLNTLTGFSKTLCNFQIVPVRNNWSDWRMMRDVKRRKCVKDHAVERVRINSMRKNDILPIEIRELADQMIQAMPRDSAFVRTHPRCQITSRPRGLVYKWRLSRIAWRNLADHNLVSGVQRAMW